MKYFAVKTGMRFNGHRYLPGIGYPMTPTIRENLKDWKDVIYTSDKKMVFENGKWVNEEKEEETKKDSENESEEDSENESEEEGF